MTVIIVFAAFFILAALGGSWAKVIFSRQNGDLPFFERIAFGGCLQIIEAILVCFIFGLFSLGAGAGIYAFAVLSAVTGILGVSAQIKRSGERDKKRNVPGISDIVFVCLFAAVTVGEIISVTLIRYEGPEAIKNVGEAVRIFESSRMAVADPMMMVAGGLSCVLSIHPLKLIYTVFPAVLITFYNICYCALIGTTVKGEKRVVAFAALTLLNVFGFQSTALVGVTMLLSWFETGTFLVHGLAGAVAVMLIRYGNSRPAGRQINDNAGSAQTEDEEWDMNRHRIINARNLAIAIGVLAVLLAFTVFILNNKINRLYDTTVSLQEDLNRRGSIFVFAPEGDRIEGYLIKGSDGELSFIGGGSEENSGKLLEFLDMYGRDIANWYVYGKDDENSGAVESLISDGSIKVGKIYVINREELEGFE